MSKTIKFEPQNSNSPTIEIAFNLAVKLHIPYSQNDVTIQINPSIEDYIENADQPNMDIRHITVSKTTDETQTLKFDLSSNKVKEINFRDQKYKFELLKIERNDNGFLFEFEVNIL